MKLSMIVALGRNRVIGVDNVMPWHIPQDLRYFKAQTMGKPVVMGRRTLQSIGKPLSGRPNIIVTRDASFHLPGVTIAANLEAALHEAHKAAEIVGADEIMIVGGGQIYEQLIGSMDRLYLTEIDLSPEGDAFFPDYNKAGKWAEISRDRHPARDGQPAFDFAVYERI